MSSHYPKSRLPGPAVRLFEIGLERDDDSTVRRGAHEEQTLTAAPEVEWALLPDCRKDPVTVVDYGDPP